MNENNSQPFTLKSLQSIAHQIAEQLPYIRLLILFGSRARGNADSTSDWDFAVLHDEEIRKQYEKGGWEYLRVWTVLAKFLELSDDDIDVVELERCSPWVVHSVARDGIVLFEKEPGEFAHFRQSALKTEAELTAYRQSVREKVRSALQRWKT